jgi:methylated-DNA-[protein]-cysteine S-methyltransferase
MKITAFQEKVYKALNKVPKGYVTTYAELGRAIGCVSARAIGGALRRNPFAPQVPCHRVIKSDLTIGGFAGKTSGEKIKKKLRLLKEEGVVFKKGKLVDPLQVFRF